MYKFRTSFLIAFIVLGCFSCWVVWRLMTVSQNDRDQLDKIIASQPRKKRKDRLQASRELTKQIRWGVLKKMWIDDGPSRRIFQLAGSRSETSVYTKDSSMQLIETFYDVEGVVQQELFYKGPDGKELSVKEAKALGKDHSLQPMQRFRYFEAQRAVHDPQAHSVTAYEVKFWTFLAEGHDIVENPLKLPPEAVGQAISMIVFSEIDQKKFYAVGLKLEIKTEEGLW